MALATEQGFALYLGVGHDQWGWALAAQGAVGGGHWPRCTRGWPPSGPRGQSCCGRCSCPAGRGLWAGGQSEEGLARC